MILYNERNTYSFRNLMILSHNRVFSHFFLTLMGVQRLVSAKAGLGYNNIRAGIAKGGVMELQRELAALVPYPAKKDISK